MKRSILLLLILRFLFFFIATAFITNRCLSQTAFKKNTFYFEIAGNAPVLSVNYERQLKDKPGFGIHIGIGLGDEYPDVPMGITYSYDLGNKKSFIEAGAGITLAEQTLWDDHAILNDIHSFKPSFVPSLAYRHQTHYGLMWRIGFVAVYTKYKTIPIYPGISIGWRI